MYMELGVAPSGGTLAALELCPVVYLIVLSARLMLGGRDVVAGEHAASC